MKVEIQTFTRREVGTIVVGEALAIDYQSACTAEHTSISLHRHRRYNGGSAWFLGTSLSKEEQEEVRKALQEKFPGELEIWGLR